MKKLFLPTIIALIVFSSFSFNDKYEKAMLKNIELVYKAQTQEDFKTVLNNLERIANAEKDKWEPHYYASFAYVMLSTRAEEISKKDEYLDLAQKQLDKGIALNEAESELVAMQGFIHMIRVSVDPATRGQQYSGMAMQSLNKAVQMNPENPRALLMLGQMSHGMAQFFGSDTSEACGLIDKSLEKFETYKSDNPLAPQWGKGQAQGMKQQCSK
ncbi:hypothetical protein QQ008_21455 [Fulvivirgaceae bacterium BMA10]|uniref:Tetratricopeptide repeat protein n=1 Tax=Splendidivirga corallicola TaxID=3051826 RepID=A0ABT8KVK2_9BACT|nr:hypothetical protein [Fulvivirgaceae bacterium BMA10]